MQTETDRDRRRQRRTCMSSSELRHELHECHIEGPATVVWSKHTIWESVRSILNLVNSWISQYTLKALVSLPVRSSQQKTTRYWCVLHAHVGDWLFRNNTCVERWHCAVALGAFNTFWACHRRELPQVSFLSRLQTRVCRDKTRVLSRQQ